MLFGMHCEFPEASHTHTYTHTVSFICFFLTRTTYPPKHVFTRPKMLGITMLVGIVGPQCSEYKNHTLTEQCMSQITDTMSKESFYASCLTFNSLSLINKAVLPAHSSQCFCCHGNITTTGLWHRRGRWKDQSEEEQKKKSD